FQLWETCSPCAVVVKGNERTAAPSAFGLLFVARPFALNLSPRALGWPECASAPSRLSKEWFSIITTTMWSNGIASLTVPAGTFGLGRLSGGRTIAPIATAARSSGLPAETASAAEPPKRTSSRRVNGRSSPFFRSQVPTQETLYPVCRFFSYEFVSG